MAKKSVCDVIVSARVLESYFLGSDNGSKMYQLCGFQQVPLPLWFCFFLCELGRGTFTPITWSCYKTWKRRRAQVFNSGSGTGIQEALAVVILTGFSVQIAGRALLLLHRMGFENSVTIIFNSVFSPQLWNTGQTTTGVYRWRLLISTNITSIFRVDNSLI